MTVEKSKIDIPNKFKDSIIEQRPTPVQQRQNKYPVSQKLPNATEYRNLKNMKDL